MYLNNYVKNCNRVLQKLPASTMTEFSTWNEIVKADFFGRAYHVVGFVSRHGIRVHDVLAVVEAGRSALVGGGIVLTACNHIRVYP